VHPDYARTGAEQAASLELSSELNQAYRTLQDPFARAEYLLRVDGGPEAAAHKTLPAEFLAEMLEAREEIELARDDPRRIEALEARFETRFEKLMSAIAAEFGRLEQPPSEAPERSKVHLKIREVLNAAKYVRGLLNDIRSER
jgi:molecular chaperone HscB